MRIFAIGDSAVSISRALDALEPGQYQVHAARGLVDALASGWSAAPDAILVDTTLNSGDRYILWERISKQYGLSHLPLIFVTPPRLEVPCVEGDADSPGAADALACHARDMAEIIQAEVDLHRRFKRAEQQALLDAVSDSMLERASPAEVADVLANVMSNLRGIVAIRDSKTSALVFLNPAWEEVTGISIRDFFADPTVFHRAIHKEDRNRVVLSRRKHLESGGGEQEWRFVRLDGEVRWVWGRDFPIRNLEGESTHVVTVMEDITARKLAELELVQHKENLERLVERRTHALVERDQQLAAQNVQLEEKAIALSQMIQQLERERRRSKEDLVASVHGQLLPLVERLTTGARDVDRTYLGLLNTQVRALVSPMSRRLTNPTYGLTPTELELCGYIKDGLSSQQIAKLIGVSLRTVDAHRRNIRKKLGLVSEGMPGGAKGQNLRVFLKGLQDTNIG